MFDLPQGFRAGILICYDNNIIENVRLTALAGADVLLAPHQTGGVGGKDPHRMGLIDPALWANRRPTRRPSRREFRGDKGRGWLMRWLPSRAHDNGLFLIFSNGVGVDDDEIRTGNAMILDPYGRTWRNLTRQRTRWSLPTSMPACWSTPPAGVGSGRAGRSCTDLSRSAPAVSGIHVS